MATITQQILAVNEGMSGLVSQRVVCNVGSYLCLGCVITDLYINNLDTGLASLSITNGNPLKLISPDQHALRR